MEKPTLSSASFTMAAAGNPRQLLLSLWRAKAIGVFEELLKSHEYARDTDSGPWNFAVEINTFKHFGVTETDLRWLIIKELVEHRHETPSSNEQGRRFQSGNALKFRNGSCFVLTPAGVEFAKLLLNEKRNGWSVLPRAPQASVAQPHWDALHRRLIVCGHTVKIFRWPAPNQELVLTAFQEEHWTNEVADPLFPVDGLSAKERLHDTIKGLNRHQKLHLIQFGGNGTGQGVVWRFTTLAHKLLEL